MRQCFRIHHWLATGEQNDVGVKSPNRASAMKSLQTHHIRPLNINPLAISTATFSVCQLSSSFGTTCILTTPSTPSPLQRGDGPARTHPSNRYRIVSAAARRRSDAVSRNTRTHQTGYVASGRTVKQNC